MKYLITILTLCLTIQAFGQIHSNAIPVCIMLGTGSDPVSCHIFPTNDSIYITKETILYTTYIRSFFISKDTLIIGIDSGCVDIPLKYVYGFWSVHPASLKYELPYLNDPDYSLLRTSDKEKRLPFILNSRKMNYLYYLYEE